MIRAGFTDSEVMKGADMSRNTVKTIKTQLLKLGDDCEGVVESLHPSLPPSLLPSLPPSLPPFLPHSLISYIF